MAKEPRWANEDWVAHGPDIDKIDCKDCAYRAEDRYYNDKLVADGAELSMCDAYENKPIEILLKGVKCPYYLSQSDEGPEKE